MVVHKCHVIDGVTAVDMMLLLWMMLWGSMAAILTTIADIWLHKKVIQ